MDRKNVFLKNPHTLVHLSQNIIVVKVKQMPKGEQGFSVQNTATSHYSTY